MSIEQIHDQDPSAGQKTKVETRRYKVNFGKGEDGVLGTILSDEYEVVHTEDLVLTGAHSILKMSEELAQSNERVKRVASAPKLKNRPKEILLKFLTS